MPPTHRRSGWTTTITVACLVATLPACSGPGAPASSTPAPASGTSISATPTSATPTSATPTSVTPTSANPASQVPDRSTPTVPAGDSTESTPAASLPAVSKEDHVPVSARQLGSLLADPASHYGESIVLFAVLTDPRAGAGFTADVTAVNPLESAEWVTGEPARFTATAEQRSALGEGDILKLWVTGSSTSATPTFRVDQLELLGTSE